eukprot:TRINITY_DN2454_c0_g1_i1.p1 TRINITY_DN2454_c0_g1~~TRINITY_DN2454_c0_g1_i1.p1  ORF type:complete len:463 (-),score=56.22 TRINITY_DN2454_c0_g1_i1:132-1520(-)
MRTLVLLCLVGAALGAVIPYSSTVCPKNKIMGYTSSVCAGTSDKSVYSDYYADFCYGVSVPSKQPYSLKVDPYCTNMMVFKGNQGCAGNGTVWNGDGSKCAAIDISTNFTGAKVMLTKQTTARTAPSIANQCHCTVQEFSDQKCTTSTRSYNIMYDGTACVVIAYHDSGKPKYWARYTNGCTMGQIYNDSACTMKVGANYSTTTGACNNQTTSSNKFTCSQPKYSDAFCQATISLYNGTTCTGKAKTDPESYVTNFCYAYKTADRTLSGTFSADCSTFTSYNTLNCQGPSNTLSVAPGTAGCWTFGGAVGAVKIVVNGAPMKNRAIIPRTESCQCDARLYTDSGCSSIYQWSQTIYSQVCTQVATGNATMPYVYYYMDPACSTMKVFSDAQCTQQIKKDGFAADATLGCKQKGNYYGSITCGTIGYTPKPASPPPSPSSGGAAQLVPSAFLAALLLAIFGFW